MCQTFKVFFLLEQFILSLPNFTILYHAGKITLAPVRISFHYFSLDWENLIRVAPCQESSAPRISAVPNGWC